MDSEIEVPRDLRGNPLRISLSSSDDSDEETSLVSDVNLPNSSSSKRATTYWRKMSVATSALQSSVQEHQKRVKEGDGVRKSLKEWSERVLQNVSEDVLETAKFIDAEQVEDEIPHQTQQKEIDELRKENAELKLKIEQLELELQRRQNSRL